MLDQEMLNKLRAIQIEILDEFVRVCEENNFTYFLTAGTLLGAVRHKGFIPWDDDVDVAMPRKDYEKFIKLYEKINDTDYYILSNRCQVNTHYHYKALSKLCKKNTLYKYRNLPKENSWGICIDIWPYDNCIRPFLPLQTYLIKFAKRIYRIKTYEFTPLNKVKAFLRKRIRYILPYQACDIFYRYSLRLYSAFNNKKTKYISFFSSIYGFIRETHGVNTIFPLTKILFEGKYYNSPNDCHAYLKTTYGNYMKLPPVEKRRIHCHNVIFDTTKEN